MKNKFWHTAYWLGSPAVNVSRTSVLRRSYYLSRYVPCSVISCYLRLSSRSFKAKLQICLAYSCTTYQQMFDGLSGSSLNTMKMATLILTSKHSVAHSTNFFQSQTLDFVSITLNCISTNV
nr:hypothetical protein BgiMline_016351 [Biomphalaria glabrata]